ncbi:hypothetical protein [Klebsiella phage RothC]|uniref:Uncharacterized protein n=2 Tax=Viruses TaxID=10239 RepID=A0AB39BZW8_9CAUD|nr:MAG TPA: hypothetical protein [Caudoviricetes sp.]
MPPLQGYLYFIVKQTCLSNTLFLVSMRDRFMRWI